MHICAICGRISCVRNFCGFCGFCGEIVWLLRGYGRMPYPPNLCTSVQSVGEYLASERVLWVLWEDSLVVAWVWQGCHTLLICAHLCNLWENILRQKLLWVLWLLWEDSFVAAWVWQDAIPSYSLHCLLCWCSGDHCTPWSCTPLKFATRLQNIFPNFVNDYFSLSD